MKRRKLTHSIFSGISALLFVACDQSTQPTALAVPTYDRAAATSAGVTVTPAAQTITQGQTLQLSAQLLSPTGKPQPNQRQLVWSSTDPAIATVSGSGMVSAVAPGTVKVIAAAEKGNPDLTGTAVITVTPACVPGANTHSPVSTVARLQGVEDKPVPFQLSATDEDLPCDSFTFQITRDPQGGFLYHTAADGSLTGPPIPPGAVLTAQDRLAYMPFPNMNGLPIGSFDFVVSDAAGNVSGITTVEIDIAPVNDAPVATSFTHTGFNDIEITDVILQVSDVESGANVQICIVELPHSGDLYWTEGFPSNPVRKGDCRSSPSLKYVRKSALGCTVVPASAYPISDSFAWYAFDGELRSSTVKDPISIVYHNNPPVFTGPFDVVAQEDGSVSFALTASDADGDPARFIIKTGPAHGTLSVLGQPILGYPTLISAVAGTNPVVTYVPNADFNTALQTESFTVNVKDGTWRLCDYAVRVAVNAVNDAPVITGPATLSASRSADGASVSAALTSDIRVADDARPGDPLTVLLVAQGAAAGRVDLVDATGLITFLQVSATEVKFQGTLSSINAALGRGVLWTPNTSTAESGALVVTVDDQGSFGTPKVSLIGSKTITVNVATDINLLGGSGAQRRTPPPQ